MSNDNQQGERCALCGRVPDSESLCPRINHPDCVLKEQDRPPRIDVKDASFRA